MSGLLVVVSTLGREVSQQGRVAGVAHPRVGVGAVLGRRNGRFHIRDYREMTGSLRVPVVWSEQCLLHDPGGEVWLGVRDAGTEGPARAQVLRDALAPAGRPPGPAPRPAHRVVRGHDDP